MLSLSQHLHIYEDLTIMVWPDLSAYLRCESVDHHAASFKLGGQLLLCTLVCQQARQGELPALDPAPGGVTEAIECRQPSIARTHLYPHTS